MDFHICYSGENSLISDQGKGIDRLNSIHRRDAKGAEKKFFIKKPSAASASLR
jgi:hypothetical protein